MLVVLRRWSVVVGLGLAVVGLGCSNGSHAGRTGSTTAPPGDVVTGDPAPGLVTWLRELPSASALWPACPPPGSPGDPTFEAWRSALVTTWLDLGAAEAPAPSEMAHRWRAFLEAGTSWASAIVEGLGTPEMLEDLQRLEADLRGGLSEYVAEELLDEQLPPSPADLVERCG